MMTNSSLLWLGIFFLSIVTTSSLYNYNLTGLVPPSDWLTWSQQKIWSFRESVSTSRKCYCSPSDVCWPTSKDLDDFSRLLSSPSALLTGIRPPAAVCHVNDPLYDVTACETARVHWNNSIWRSDQPGGMIEVEFESAAAWQTNKTLAFSIHGSDSSLPCGQGSVPTFGVNVSTEDDIVKSLNFAAKHNLQISIKNSGHDYFGRSLIPGSFLIWTHNFKKSVIEEKFVAENCPTVSSQNVLRLGSGSTWLEAYETANGAGRVVIGGVSVNGTVGAAGGWLMGGGHSVLSPMYGLGVDNVLEMRVVLPPRDENDEARIVTTNACSEPDLFWALRGGGGGTYGIITEVVYKTYEITKVLTGGLSLSTTSPETYQEILETYLAGLPTLSDNRFGGYWFTYATPSASSNTTTYSLIYYFLRTNYTDVEKPLLVDTLKSLFDKLQTLLNSSTPIYSIGEHESFWSWFLANQALMGRAVASVGEKAPIEHGGTYTLSSKLLPKDVHVGQKGKELAKHLMTVSRTFVCATPGGQSLIPDPDAMGLNPAWRSAITLMLLYDTPEANAQRSTADFLINLIGGKGGGAYLNEASYTDPTWPYSYWGDHYSRLKELKKRYDPNNQFIVTKGVASEEWETDLKCRKAR